jgi:hypothetical protein
MAQQKMTAEQLKAIQKMKNEQYMALTYTQQINANAQNGNSWGLGKNLQFDAPIVASANAQKITLRHNLTVTVAGASVTPTASFPYSLVNNVVISFGSKVATFHPYLAKIQAMIEGYARKEFDNSGNFKATRIDNMLRSVPSGTMAAGTYTVKFDTDYELNALHPVSVNGLIPIYSSGTRLQTTVNLPTQVVADKADALDHAFEGAGATVTVTGTVDVIITYRDDKSMTTRQNLDLDLNGLPTVQCIQLPSANLLSQGAMNYVSIRNPYPFAKIFHFVLDGNQSDVFAKADNILAYSLDKAENSNSSLIAYNESNGGIVNLYKNVREKFGTDLPEGVIVHDFTTDNIANVSGKQGGAYLNLTGEGYPASRFGVKLSSVNNTDRVSKIISYGIILNGEGIQTR